MLRLVSAAFILSSLLFVSLAHADAPELMNFNYIQDQQAVGAFYDGGGGTGIPNFGVTFNNFWAVRGNVSSYSFAPDPTNSPIVFINTTATAPQGTGDVTGTMNVAPGFTTGMNFIYTLAFAGSKNPNQSELITVWSGVNGTGKILGTLRLYSNDGSCNGNACMWTSVFAGFSGTAHSVTFTGPAAQMGVSDITLNSTQTQIPEPSSIYLLLTGVAGVSASQLRRFFGM